MEQGGVGCGLHGEEQLIRVFRGFLGSVPVIRGWDQLALRVIYSVSNGFYSEKKKDQLVVLFV